MSPPSSRSCRSAPRRSSRPRTRRSCAARPRSAGRRPRSAATPSTAGPAAAVRSGARVGPSRAAFASTSRGRYAAGARIVPRVRILRVLMDGGRAVGVEGTAIVTDPATGRPLERTDRRWRPDHAAVDRSCPDRRPGRRRAAHAGDPAGDRRGPRPHRAAPAAASRAGGRRTVRGPDRHVAGHHAGRQVACSSRTRPTGGTATSSRRPRVIRACWRSRSRGRAGRHMLRSWPRRATCRRSSP